MKPEIEEIARAYLKHACACPRSAVQEGERPEIGCTCIAQGQRIALAGEIEGLLAGKFRGRVVE